MVVDFGMREKTLSLAQLNQRAHPALRFLRMLPQAGRLVSSGLALVSGFAVAWCASFLFHDIATVGMIFVVVTIYAFLFFRLRLEW